MEAGDRGADIVKLARENGVNQVRVVFLDYNGIARARSVQLDSLPGAFSRGVNFSSPTVEFNSREVFPPGAAFDLTSPDVWAVPDPASYHSVPHAPGVGQMYADLVDARRRPWAGCPRTLLRRMVDRAGAAGIRFNVGFEPEGYIFRRTDGEPQLVGIREFASADGLDLEPGFMSALVADLASAGLKVEQWSEEYGPGQIEVNLRYLGPVEAADGLTTFKQTFRAVARTFGLQGTFMPKPFANQAGCGLHVHLSASPSDAIENLFEDRADELGLSPLARHALGGLLRHGEALTALGATTVNSYKRFLPGSWAPTDITYSYANRAAFIRIPERETARRLELRVGDGAGNPYLYLSGILAAMLDGIEHEIGPGSPVEGDVSGLGPSEKDALGARPLPRSLDKALKSLEADEVVMGAVGSPIAEEFIKVKRSEWDAFAMHVGEWDREWYLDRY